MKAIELVNQFEKFAPKNIAVDGDPIGLQIGNLDQDVSKVLVTLDVRPEVVKEAIDKGCNMIFSHHPLMFRPAKNLDLSNPQNKMYADIIKHDIVVYSAHTNLDNAEGGMNDWLAEAMDLRNVEGLVDQGEYLGHEYYMGRIGELKEATTVLDFAKKCKEYFNVDGLRLVSHELDHPVKRVAVLGGDGGKFYSIAKQKKADVYVTGDVYYHVGHDMIANHMSVVDPGHHIESICKPYLAEMFKEWAKEFDWSVDVIESNINTDPYLFI
ncbi:Nif3-like dinuclear metal center hexameric protein [Apilactobacillus bombintestini]|uniref:GTP cyclohydrolase 1 type 2 homolog n=1 Tax=Apilactobacillus bombintestini TaxID=2419772 RepID=A0A387AT58_9LACO|nr:Nif3-like dinuclear metal center hexameric protein [Apilactobacillus bombintestini]AYF92539.1 Nif3-like dinuclear metal center hexameric protein [Apilactobacillus bombintestini]